MANEPAKRVVIVDIDGTVANHDGIRGHYEYQKVDRDAPVQAIVRLVRLLAEHHQIVFISGREERARKATVEWLEQQGLGFAMQLLMRTTGDFRQDSIVKRELYERHIKGQYEIELVLDDRNVVVEMWRKLGLVCLQVADGNF